MADLTLAELRTLVTTGLVDAALQVLLDDAYATIEGAVGAAGERSEVVEPAGELLPLSRRAAAVSAVVEEVRWWNLALAADDYELDPSGLVLRRLLTGTNPRSEWWGLCRVTYTPVDDAARRNAAAVDLVKLELNYSPGLASTTIGSWSESYATSGRSYAEQRADILARLSDGPRGFVG